ncbi:MAG: hypothetical protein ACTSVU_09875, partial [Promethearchaeota archaeon]
MIIPIIGSENNYQDNIQKKSISLPKSSSYNSTLILSDDFTSNTENWTYIADASYDSGNGYAIVAPQSRNSVGNMWYSKNFTGNFSIKFDYYCTRGD